MVENMDCGYILSREFKGDLNQWFLSLKEIKARGKKIKPGMPDVKYFVHPFAKENTIRLMEDEGTKENYSANSLSSMGSGGMINTTGNQMTGRPKSRISKSRRQAPATTGFEQKDDEDELSDL